MRFAIATSIFFLAVLAAAAPDSARRAIPITKRYGFVNSDSSLDIEALNSHIASTKTKIQRGLSNFRNNTGVAHPGALKGPQKRGGAPDTLTDYENQLWYGDISVGTPARTFTVLFDTGSSDTFLPGPKCGSTCSGHTIYNPSSSSTSQDLDKSFELSFGDGAVIKGEQYTDTVAISGLTASKQTLGVASQYSYFFEKAQTPADGLVGMGYESISAFKASPVFQSLVSQGQVEEPAFSFKLTPTGAELYVGGANSALYTGSFTYTPVAQQGYWQVNMDNILGNGLTVLTDIDSVIDTGTTLVIGIPSQVKEFYEAVGGTDASRTVGQGYYTFPCNSFPDVSFTFGGASWPIAAGTMNLGPVSEGSSDCVSAIVGADVGGSFWIIGDVFLQNVYTQFDFGNNQVGFAKLLVG